MVKRIQWDSLGCQSASGDNNYSKFESLQLTACYQMEKTSPKLTQQKHNQSIESNLNNLPKFI